MDVEGTLSTNPFIKREEIDSQSEVDEIHFEFCSVEKREIEETDTSSHSQNALLYTEETTCVNNLDGINQIKGMRHKLNSTEKQKGQYSRETRLFKCDECDYKSIRQGALTRHLLRHKDPHSQMQTYNCSKCDYKSIRSANLKQHQLRWHKDPSEVRVFKCNECDYQSTRKDSLQQHQLRHKNPSDIDMHKCDQCKFETKLTKSLKQHQLSHKDPSEVRMFKCSECDFKSMRRSSLREHQLRHKDPSEVQMYKCDKCDYKSIRKDKLRRHQMIHMLPSEVRALKSHKESDYKSIQSGSLKQHKDIAEVQTYGCDKCDYNSVRKSDLKRHQLRHKDPSKVRTFKCDECDYKSIRKDHLRQHQMIHKLPTEVRELKADEERDHKSIRKSNLKPECKLCAGIINDEEFKVIEDVPTNIFNVLLHKLTLDNEARNVMCTMCFSKLLAAFNFKSTCLGNILSFVDFKNPKSIDLKKIHAKEKESEKEKRMLDDGEICRLCLLPTGSAHKSIKEVPVESLQIYIPEINSAVVTNPIICVKCHDALCVHGSFIKKCLDVKKKRTSEAVDVDDILFTSPCIKTEKIDLDETLSEILGDMSKEEPEIVRNCLDVEKKRNMDAIDVGEMLPFIKIEEIEIKSDD